MKTYIFAAFASATILASSVSAQNITSTIKQLIDAQSYVFEAEWALPTTGGSRHLTTPYTLVVGKDSIIADLPYFGRAYSPPLNLSQAGIKFTSTSFSYTQKPVKNGWSIVIKPKDDSYSTQLFFTIFDNGSATLQINSNNRDGIAFNGYIHAKKTD